MLRVENTRPGPWKRALVGDWPTRTLRPELGGWPLPAAGGQPRRCTGARPNPFPAVGSENTRKKPRAAISGCSRLQYGAQDCNALKRKRLAA